jgi:phosphoribosylformimino-5-aminoimidazole carboxamide ribotide isomerase
MDRLKSLRDLVGRERIVIDLSCRKKTGQENGPYYVVTNKWTQYTNYAVT